MKWLKYAAGEGGNGVIPVDRKFADVVSLCFRFIGVVKEHGVSLAWLGSYLIACFVYYNTIRIDGV